MPDRFALLHFPSFTVYESITFVYNEFLYTQTTTSMAGGSYGYVFFTVITHHKGHLHLGPRVSSKQIMVKKKMSQRLKIRRYSKTEADVLIFWTFLKLCQLEKKLAESLLSPLVEQMRRGATTRSGDEERRRGSPPRLQRLLNNACLFKDNERECICRFFFNLNETSEASRPACLLVYIIIKGGFVVSQLR